MSERSLEVVGGGGGARELEVVSAKPLSTEAVLVAQQRLVNCMEQVMVEKIDYGAIPGTGDKPTLLKPGSEKILSMFRIAVDPVIEDLSIPDECIRYRVTCRLLDSVTQAYLGAGVGECSSNETKYKWRTAVCDEEWNETPADQRRIKWGWKWGQKRGEKISIQTKQVRTPHDDFGNTVLKMAKKRAQIDACLTVTAASSVFSQDLDDIDETLREALVEEEHDKEQEEADAVQTPQAKKEAKPAAKKVASKKKASSKKKSASKKAADKIPPKAEKGSKWPDKEERMVEARVKKMGTKDGGTDEKPWTRTWVEFDNGLSASGFHHTFPEKFQQAQNDNALVVCRVARNDANGKTYFNIEAVEDIVYTDEPDEPDDSEFEEETDGFDGAEEGDEEDE